nr:DUF6252 family protein [uncultured Flavobacterium sp.]
MKKLKIFGVVLTTALSTLFISCSSDDGGSGGGFSGPSTGTFVKAKPGGSNFLAEGTFASGAYSSGNLVLTGTSTTGKSIGIQLYALDGTLDVGTYDVGALSNSSAYTGNLTYIDVNTSTFEVVTYNSAFCDSSTGTIEITFVDANKIEGTFSFEGKEVRDGDDCSGSTKNVTNGSFRIEL